VEPQGCLEGRPRDGRVWNAGGDRPGKGLALVRRRSPVAVPRCTTTGHFTRQAIRCHGRARHLSPIARLPFPVAPRLRGLVAAGRLDAASRLDHENPHDGNRRGRVRGKGYIPQPGDCLKAHCICTCQGGSIAAKGAGRRPLVLHDSETTSAPTLSLVPRPACSQVNIEAG
jgi:hypothetical protein